MPIFARNMEDITLRESKNSTNLNRHRRHCHHQKVGVVFDHQISNFPKKFADPQQEQRVN